MLVNIFFEQGVAYIKQKNYNQNAQAFFVSLFPILHYIFLAYCPGINLFIISIHKPVPAKSEIVLKFEYQHRNQNWVEICLN